MVFVFSWYDCQVGRSVVFYFHVYISGLYHDFPVQHDDTPLVRVFFHCTIVAYRLLDTAVDGWYDDTLARFQSPFQSGLERHSVCKGEPTVLSVSFLAYVVCPLAFGRHILFSDISFDTAALKVLRLRPRESCRRYTVFLYRLLHGSIFLLRSAITILPSGNVFHKTDNRLSSSIISNTQT